MAELHQSLLMVSDIDESRAFYENIVGLTPAVVADGNIEYETGDCTLVLESDFPEPVRDEFGLRDPPKSRGGGAIIAIGVKSTESVDEIFNRAREHGPMGRMERGSTVRMEPTEVGWGRYMMLLADPDEYSIEVSAPIE
jgi:catechol 2,3-dioxygenase-like lactoylglutathione lyase family enzyme